MQSINSIKTYAYGTIKNLVNEKEETKCNNIIKRYKKSLILMMLQNKTLKNIIQIANNILIIHTEN